jgi:hypothetical protein
MRTIVLLCPWVRARKPGSQCSTRRSMWRVGRAERADHWQACRADRAVQERAVRSLPVQGGAAGAGARPDPLRRGRGPAGPENDARPAEDPGAVRALELLAARLRTTAFPEAVCGTSAAAASFVGHDQQWEGGSPSSPASSVPAENVHASLNRRSPSAPARADGRCHASWERRSAGP